MADKTTQIKIFIEGNNKKEGISLGAYHKEKKTLDLSDKVEYGICMPTYIYDALQRQAQKINIDFVTYFRQALEESLHENISNNYCSLQPLNDTRYIKIKVRSKLEKLYEKYSKLISKLYKKLLGVHKNTRNSARPDYQNSEINRELLGINYYLGINEFTNGISHIISNYVYENIPLEIQEELYSYYEQKKYNELYKKISDVSYRKEHYLKTKNDLEVEAELLIADEEIEEIIINTISGYYCEYYAQQKVFSLLLSKEESFSSMFNEKILTDALTPEEDDEKNDDEQYITQKIRYNTFRSDELLLFVPDKTYNYLKAFSDFYSHSIDEIAYYFIYTRLELLNSYIKKLMEMSDTQVDDNLLKISDKGSTLKDAFKRPYLFKKYIQKEYNHVSGYMNFCDLGLILPQKTIDLFYTSFVRYKNKNHDENLDSDYMIFLLHNYINSHNNID